MYIKFVGEARELKSVCVWEWGGGGRGGDSKGMGVEHCGIPEAGGIKTI